MTEEHTAPAEAPSRSSNVLAVCGWITAVVFPPVGVLLGAMLASRDDKRGRWILGVAGAMIVLWVIYVIVLLNAADDQAARSYYYE